MSVLKVPVVSTDHAQGDAHAPITLVEYGDYECPSCGEAYPIVKQVQKHFGKRLRLVFRNFPLKEIHPNAESAAETAEFAAANDRFWEMHDGLFENQEEMDSSLFMELTQTLGLPVPDLQIALDNGAFAARVRADFLGGVRSGVNGTPTFFINGRRHDGSYELEELTEAIEAQLTEK